MYRAAGVGPEDRVLFGFSFGPFIGFWSAFGGAERLGALTIPGGAMTTEQRIGVIEELQPTVLLCTPTYALRLADVAAQMGVDLAASSIRVTIHAGEAGASIPATREAIETAFGATCVDHSGMTELGPTGFSCTQRDGLHLVESEFIFEVLDGDGRPSPEGELVATNLGRWGTPLVRYRTGDRVQVSREACGCGSPFLKLAGGIRTAKDAIRYLVLAREVAGEEWLTPALLRIGASSLLNDLLMQRRKQLTGAYAGPDHFTLD